MNENDKRIAKRILLIHSDIADLKAEDAAKTLSGGLPGKGWSVLWIDPHALEQSETAKKRKGSIGKRGTRG